MKIKKILRIILLSPFIICFILFDIIKLPIHLFIIFPMSFLLYLADYLKDDLEWFNNWVDFNLETISITYMMKDELL